MGCQTAVGTQWVNVSALCSVILYIIYFFLLHLKLKLCPYCTIAVCTYKNLKMLNQMCQTNFLHTMYFLIFMARLVVIDINLRQIISLPKKKIYFFCFFLDTRISGKEETVQRTSTKTFPH